jgi:hypothetical protein
VSYPDEWNHHPLAQPVETDAMQTLSSCARLLQRAADTLFGQDQVELFNKIKGLQHEAEQARQQLLIPPAP